MKNKHDPLVFYDALSPEEQEELREELADNSDRAEALRMWQAVRAGLRERLRERVPDRRVLVLYALDHAGRSDLLSDDEQATLEEARPDLERALREHPGLAGAVRRIQQDQTDFEAVWDEHTSTETPSRQRASGRQSRQPAARRQGQRSASTSWRRWASRGALGVAALVFVALLVLLLQRDRAMLTATAPASSARVVELDDGSTARLAPGAKLTYPDPDEWTVFARRARLDGRAFFDITPQEDRFTIETPTAAATVLGTSFGLDAREDVTTLTGVEGRVRFANRETEERAVVVTGGQRSRVARNALPSTPTRANVSEALAWTNLFLFRATPARRIAERLSSFYDVTITVASPLANKKVTGTFEQNRPVREVLGVLATTLQAEVQPQEGGGYRLVPAA